MSLATRQSCGPKSGLSILSEESGLWIRIKCMPVFYLYLHKDPEPTGEQWVLFFVPLEIMIMATWHAFEPPNSLYIKSNTTSVNYFLLFRYLLSIVLEWHSDRSRGFLYRNLAFHLSVRSHHGGLFNFVDRHLEFKVFMRFLLGQDSFRTLEGRSGRAPESTTLPV